MSRYGLAAEIPSTAENPYPPILEFVPAPPYPSASSSASRLTTQNNVKPKTEDCANINNETDNEENSGDSTWSDPDDNEGIPDLPFDPLGPCLPSECPAGLSSEIPTTVEETERYAEGKDNRDEEIPIDVERTPPENKPPSRWRRLVQVENRLSDISIHDQEYQTALGAGKIQQLNGKEQQLFEPLLGEVAPESKRIEFHFFLKKSGVLSVIARSVLALYDDPNRPEPENAIEYMINSVGYQLTFRDKIREMKRYKETLMIRQQRLSVENDWLHRAFDIYEPTELNLNGREPNPYNKLQFPPEENYIEDREEVLGFLRENFPPPPQPSYFQRELITQLEEDEDSMLSLEEFRREMKQLDPDYLNFSDTSADEYDDVGEKVKSREPSDIGLHQSSNSPPVTVSGEITASPTTNMVNHPVEGAHHRADNKKTGRKSKKKARVPTIKALKADAENILKEDEIIEESIEPVAMPRESEFGHIYDPEYTLTLNQLINEEESDEEKSKRAAKWFEYDYGADDDVCGFGKLVRSGNSISKGHPMSHSASTAHADLDDNYDEEVPILYDTSDDETGLEFITAEIRGHLNIEAVTVLPADSDEDKEPTNDYQEPDLSSDEEIFGRRQKRTHKKFRLRKFFPSPTDDASDDELAKITADPDQEKDILEMTPFVPFSSDEDELDVDLQEPPSYEFPIRKPIIFSAYK